MQTKDSSYIFVEKFLSKCRGFESKITVTQSANTRAMTYLTSIFGLWLHCIPGYLYSHRVYIRLHDYLLWSGSGISTSWPSFMVTKRNIKIKILHHKLHFFLWKGYLWKCEEIWSIIEDDVRKRGNGKPYLHWTSFLSI